MKMDKTYTGTYGRLRVLRPEFLGSSFIDQMDERNEEEFVKSLASSSYKQEVDAFTTLYKVPDLVEVVINAHMLRMIRNATFALPQNARNFISAYMGKWDIENIKTLLSSKQLGYDVEHTEAFLVIERDIPVGIFSGVIKRDDWLGMIGSKDVETVVQQLVKYGYGTILLKHLDEYKKTKDLSAMIAALDTYYFNNLISTFKFYNGTENMLLSYIKEIIDIKNILIVMKAIELKYKNITDYIIRGGTIPENKLIEWSGKDIQSLKAELPYKIDDAFDAYKTDPFMTYFDTALKRELDKKYIKLFESLVMSLEFIFAFVLRSEIERDELRTVWLGKYYKISKERIDRLRILKYIEK